jgi:hypothetical protein
MAGTTIDLAVSIDRIQLRLSVTQGDRVRRTTIMEFLTREVDDLVAALIAQRAHMLPSPQSGNALPTRN